MIKNCTNKLSSTIARLATVNYRNVSLNYVSNRLTKTKKPTEYFCFPLTFFRELAWISFSIPFRWNNTCLKWDSEIKCQYHSVRTYCNMLLPQTFKSITAWNATYKSSKKPYIAEVCNFTKSNTSPWVFFTFLKLYKWHQMTQRITFYNIRMHLENAIEVCD